MLSRGGAVLGATAQAPATPTGPYTVPPLAYPFAALEPHIDAMTMQIHHDRHHQTYVTNLNNLVATTFTMGTDGSNVRRGTTDVPQGGSSWISPRWAPVAGVFMSRLRSSVAGDEARGMAVRNGTRVVFVSRASQCVAA